MFGGKGGGTAPPGPSARQLGGGFGLLVILVLLVWLASGFYIVDASQRGVVLRFGKFLRDQSAGPALASALADRIGRDRQRVRSPHRRNRLPQQRASSKVPNESLMLTDDENIIDHSVRRAIHPQQSRGVPVHQPRCRPGRDAGCRIGDPRSRGKKQDGFRALRGQGADRGQGAGTDAGHSRPLQDRYFHQPGDHAERAAAGAGAGGIRRCGQGRPGPRAPEERRPGLRQ